MCYIVIGIANHLPALRPAAARAAFLFARSGSLPFIHTPNDDLCENNTIERKEVFPMSMQTTAGRAVMHIVRAGQNNPQIFAIALPVLAVRAST